jgi:hypothetical protein
MPTRPSWFYTIGEIDMCVKCHLNTSMDSKEAITLVTDNYAACWHSAITLTRKEHTQLTHSVSTICMHTGTRYCESMKSLRFPTATWYNAHQNGYVSWRCYQGCYVHASTPWHNKLCYQLVFAASQFRKYTIIEQSTWAIPDETLVMRDVPVCTVSFSHIVHNVCQYSISGTVSWGTLSHRLTHVTDYCNINSFLGW